MSFDLLRGRRDADSRQQTLRATIEWSHDLLSPEEQMLFRQLSVFVAGCSLEAALQVCDASLDTLQEPTSALEVAAPQPPPLLTQTERPEPAKG